MEITKAERVFKRILPANEQLRDKLLKSDLPDDIKKLDDIIKELEGNVDFSGYLFYTIMGSDYVKIYPMGEKGIISGINLPETVKGIGLGYDTWNDEDKGLHLCFAYKDIKFDITGFGKKPY